MKCLRCEGCGVIRNYLNRAGDYTQQHCPDCKGSGFQFDCSCDTCEPKPEPVYEPINWKFWRKK